MNTLLSDLLSVVDQKRFVGVSDATLKVLLKERLQDYVLGFIYNHKEYGKLVFYGGTCLRKLFGLNRLSEDLDFENIESIDLSAFEVDLKDFFRGRYDLDNVTTTTQGLGNIYRITIKFPILYDLGLSPFESENLHVKVEVNQKLTGRYGIEVSPYVSGNSSALIRHYSIDVLMSGKITAALDRVYEKGKTGIAVKGRDYYDLVWYMQKQILPNGQKLLDVNTAYSLGKVFDLLDDKVNKIKSADLYLDLEAYFEEKQFIKDWCDNFHDLYERYREFYKSY